MIQWIWILLVLLWMVMIFWFSAKPAPESSKQSIRIGMWISRFFEDDFTEWTPEEQTAYAGGIEHTVRKCAHFMEYAVLALLLYMALMSVERRRCRFPAAWLIAVLYAVTDEIHQIFVPGRSGQIRDVALDACGAACMLLLIVLIGRVWRGKKQE